VTKTDQPNTPALRFDAVLEEELAEIARRRQLYRQNLKDTRDREPKGREREQSSHFVMVSTPPLARERLENTSHPTGTTATEPTIQASEEFHAQHLFPTRKKEDASSAAVSTATQTVERSGQPGRKVTAIDKAHEYNLFGMAFSGGGIRSATFNLGVLQGLAKRNLLHHVDYLSTISGGGYIGAWLTAWIYRRNMAEVETRLGADRKDQLHYKSPPEVEFLREYSNYLTPRKGLLGADTWTAVAIYLRNLILNQLVLILFIASVLLVPYALVAFAQTTPPKWAVTYQALFLGIPFLLIGIIGVFTMLRNMRNYSTDPEPDRVLASVVEQSGEKELRIQLFPSDTPDRFDRLFRPGLFVEIWDRTIRTRRNESGADKVSTIEKPAQGQSATKIGFENPIRAYPEDLIIAAYPKWAQPKNVFWCLALPIFAGSGFLSCILASYGRNTKALPFNLAFLGVGLKGFLINLDSSLWWTLAGGTILFLFWLLAFFLFAKNLDTSSQTGRRKCYSQAGAFVSPWIAGAVGALLLWEITPILHKWNCDHADGTWKVLGAGSPLVALILLGCTVIQIGILGDVFQEPRREWWGRLAAMILILCSVWAAVFALAHYGPVALIKISQYPRAKWIPILGWVFSTAAGVFGAKSAKVGTPDSRDWKDLALSVTPYVFIVGLLMLVSWGIYALPFIPATGRGSGSLAHGKPVEIPATNEPSEGDLEVSFSGRAIVPQKGTPTLDFKISQPRKVPAPPSPKPDDSKVHTWYIYVALLICLTSSILLATRVDLNEFSMHYLYRNRLVRCYLGASHRERVPNPLTGFDENDDLHLADMTTSKGYDGPLPIFGTALNLVHGKDLAWQERKAESFAITPLRCGFDVWFERSARPGQYGNANLDDFGFRSTRDFAYPGGLYLGTAMAISGAAASPNMGYHSSPALSFLMTIFNVRLGWWVGNPRRPDCWQKSGPFLGLGYLLMELFGYTDDTGAYVYLSDGGHFENLGLYELVKRRCRFIIASDVGADKDLSFGDLGSAIRKCRSDMGIDIKIRTDRIVAGGTPPYSKWHCTMADIIYEKSDPLVRNENPNGVLLYIKSSLTSDESADVLNYKSCYPHFPHQSTADQWFTESQFESYRALGEHIMESALQPAVGILQQQTDLQQLMDTLGQFWKNREEIQNVQWPPDTGP
jgi:predicted acylesterase/phospholipase RssA